MSHNTTFIDLVVSKPLVQKLHKLGLTAMSSFTYRDFNDSTFSLFSKLFDPMGLYSPDLLPPGVEQSFEELPAYTFGDMAILLPCGWQIHNEGVHFHCILPEVYQQQPTEATSFVDAAALMVIQMIESGILTPTHANQIITPQLL